MNRVATLPEKERNELFTLTAERLGMGTVAVVEKDFWVCWTLKQLFEHPELSKQLIFKGGTSLSKVYGMIDLEATCKDYLQVRRKDSRETKGVKRKR